MNSVSQPWHWNPQTASYMSTAADYEPGSIQFQQRAGTHSVIHLIHRNNKVQSFSLPQQVFNEVKESKQDQQRIIEFINLYLNETDDNIEWYAHKTGMDCIQKYLKSLATTDLADKIIYGTQISNIPKAVYTQNIQNQQVRQLSWTELMYNYHQVMATAVNLESRLKEQAQKKRAEYEKQYGPIETLSDQKIEKLQKLQFLHKRCLLNLQSIVSSVDGYLQQIFIIFQSAGGRGFQEIWKTNEAMIMKSLDNIKILSKKINADLRDLKQLALEVNIMKGTYAVILAGAQALIACQVLLNSKFRLLYCSDAMSPSDNQIFTQYRVLQKNAFSPCWELFLTSRIYDRKSWTPNKKYELQRLALMQLDSQSLKRFSHLFEQVQSVKQQIEAINESIDKKQGTFRTYLWASLTGKAQSFFQNLGRFVGNTATYVAKFLGFRQKQNQAEVQQLKQRKDFIQTQVAEKAKKIKQYEEKNIQLNNQILTNVTNLNSKTLMNKAIVMENTEVEAVGFAQKNFAEERKDQNLIQAGKALIAASNANRDSQIAKSMMTDKLISKQLDAVDQKRMFQEQKAERNENEMQQQMDPQYNVNYSKKVLTQLNQKYDQITKQPIQTNQLETRKKRRLHTTTKIKQQTTLVKKVYQTLQNHTIKFDKKIRLIVKKTSTQKLDNILKGQIELKQQIEQFRTKTLSLLEQKMSDIETLKKRETIFYKRIEMLEEKKLLNDTVTRELNSQIVDNIQANVSAVQFFRQIMTKIQKNLTKQSVSYQTLVKGIQELKTGSDAGALSITSNAANYLTQISFNSYASMTKLSIEQIRAMVKATPQQILTHFNSSASLISNELNRAMGSIKADNKSILQGMSYLTSSIQLIVQQRKDVDTSLIQSFNTAIKSQCQQVINLVSVAVNEMKQNNVQVKESIISHLQTMNSYIQNVATQTQNHVTMCFNALNQTLTNQFQTIRAYQHQISHQLQQNKRQNDVNRIFLEQNRSLTVNQIQRTQYLNQVNFQQHQNRSQQNSVINEKVDQVLKIMTGVNQTKDKQLEMFKNKLMAVTHQRDTFKKELEDASSKVRQARKYNQQLSILMNQRKQQDRQMAELIKYASKIAVSKSLKPIKTYNQLKSFIYSIGHRIQDEDLSQKAQERRQLFEAVAARKTRDLQLITNLKQQLMVLSEQVRQHKLTQKGLENQLSHTKLALSRLNDTSRGEQTFAQINHSIIQDLKDLSSLLSYGTRENFQNYRTSEVVRLYSIIQRHVGSIEKRSKEQIQSLERKIKQTTSQFQALKKKTSKVNSDVSDKQLTINQLESEKTNLQQKIHSLTRKINEYQNSRLIELKDNSTIEKLTLQLKNSRQQLKEKLNQLSKLSEETNQRAAQLATKRCEVRKLTQDLQSKNDELKQLKTQYMKQKSAKDANIRELQQRLNAKSRQAQLQKSKMKMQKKQQTTVLNMLGGEEYQDLSEMAKNQTKKITQLNKQIAQLRQKNEALMKTQTQQNSKIGNLKNKINNLEQKVGQQQKKNFQIALIKSKLQVQAKNQEEKIRQNDSKLRTLQEKIQILEKQKRKKQETLTQSNITNVQYQQENKGFKRRLVILQMQVSNIQAQNEQLKKLNDKYAKMINSLENNAINSRYDISSRQEAIEGLKQSLNKLQKQIDKKKEIVATLQKKLEKQQGQSKKKDETMDDIREIVSDLNVKVITSKVIKKKLCDYQAQKQSQYNGNLKRAIARLTDTIKQIDRDYVDWNVVVKQIKQQYGISEQISIDFSNKELSEKLIQFIHQKVRQSEKKKFYLEKQANVLTEQLEQTKKKVQNAERLATMLQTKHKLSKQSLQAQQQKQQSKIMALSGINKKLQLQLHETNLALVKLQGQLKDKQYQFQSKLLQYKQFVQQKQQLAIALCLNKQDSIIKILQTILLKNNQQLPQRVGVSDEVWITTLVSIMQKKRQRKSIRKSGDDSDGEEKYNTKTKLKIIPQKSLDITIQNSAINISIGGNGGGGGEQPPNQKLSQPADQIPVRNLEYEYQLAKLDYDKLKNQLDKLQSFFIEFESIFIFLMQKLIRLLQMCARYLESFKQKNYVDPQKQKVTQAFLIFVGSIVSWIHRLFGNIKFDQFISDYMSIRHDLFGLAKKMGQGIYLIDANSVKGIQLRVLMTQIQTFMKGYKLSSIPRSS